MVRCSSASTAQRTTKGGIYWLAKWRWALGDSDGIYDFKESLSAINPGSLNRQKGDIQPNPEFSKKTDAVKRRLDGTHQTEPGPCPEGNAHQILGRLMCPLYQY
jgi:hypothetical protein